MPTPVTYNRAVDKNQTFFFQFKMRQGNDYIDISAYEFEFLLKTKVGAIIWDVLNADFTRPDNFTIRFQKSISDLSSVANGLYNMSFLVTNTDMTDNEYMVGLWEFKNS